MGRVSRVTRPYKLDHWNVFIPRIVIFLLTLSPPLNQAEIGGFGGLQFLEKGDEGIAASLRINHFVQNFTENQMVKSAMF
jgi:hypothetical protein